MADERRANPRFTCELVAGIEADGTTHAGRSADVSMGGASLRIAAAVTAGSEVHVLLTLGFGWTAKDFLRLPATVIRCVADDDAYVVAVEFHPIEDEAAHRQLDLLIRLLRGDLERDLAAYRASVSG